MTKCHFLFSACLLAILLGCQSAQPRTYDVTVKNRSSGPITIWLTKSGPPYEDGWLSPEDLAVESPKIGSKMISGVVVPAGKVASTGVRKGQFDDSTRAVLRVYGGQLSFEQILATSYGQRSRVDVDLRPGASSYIVTGQTELIEVKEGE